MRAPLDPALRNGAFIVILGIMQQSSAEFLALKQSGAPDPRHRGAVANDERPGFRLRPGPA